MKAGWGKPGPIPPLAGVEAWGRLTREPAQYIRVLYKHRVWLGRTNPNPNPIPPECGCPTDPKGHPIQLSS